MLDFIMEANTMNPDQTVWSDSLWLSKNKREHLTRERMIKAVTGARGLAGKIISLTAIWNRLQHFFFTLTTIDFNMHE